MADIKTKILCIAGAAFILLTLILTFRYPHRDKDDLPAGHRPSDIPQLVTETEHKKFSLDEYLSCISGFQTEQAENNNRLPETTSPDEACQTTVTPEARSDEACGITRRQLVSFDQWFRLLCLGVFFILSLIALNVWKKVKRPRMKELNGRTDLLEKNVGVLMDNAIRKEDLSKRCFWTKEALREYFGYDGPEKCDEFIKWAYMRIWYYSDFANEQTKRIACDALKWGYIISLDDYARYVSAYKDCELDFRSLDDEIDALEKIRTKDLQKKSENIGPIVRDIDDDDRLRTALFPEKVNPFEDYAEEIENYADYVEEYAEDVEDISKKAGK